MDPELATIKILRGVEHTRGIDTVKKSG